MQEVQITAGKSVEFSCGESIKRAFRPHNQPQTEPERTEESLMPDVRTQSYFRNAAFWTGTLEDRHLHTG